MSAVDAGVAAIDEDAVASVAVGGKGAAVDDEDIAGGATKVDCVHFLVSAVVGGDDVAPVDAEGAFFDNYYIGGEFSDLLLGVEDAGAFGLAVDVEVVFYIDAGSVVGGGDVHGAAVGEDEVDVTQEVEAVEGYGGQSHEVPSLFA